MKIDTKIYSVDDISIEWGVSFIDVSKRLHNIEQYKPFGGWPNIRCKCNNIFGLNVAECNLRAPQVDRPVLQVHYELSPIKPKFWERLHSPFIKKLKEKLGKPQKTEIIYNQAGYKKEFISGAVVFSATWIFDDIRISLSVYGGTRNNESGQAAAGLFIDWIDEKKAAKPFRDKNQRNEEELDKFINDNLKLDKFILTYPQRKFRMVDYELKDPFIAEKDNELRVSQLALYKKELFQTPAALQKKLAENDVVFFYEGELGRWFLSTKWETVSLSKSDENSITYYDILPARGPGGHLLEVKELTINDSRNSETILYLVDKIQTELGINIKRAKGYDD